MKPDRYSRWMPSMSSATATAMDDALEGEEATTDEDVGEARVSAKPRSLVMILRTGASGAGRWTT